eukprot:s3558_g2.t4
MTSGGWLAAAALPSLRRPACGGSQGLQGCLHGLKRLQVWLFLPGCREPPYGAAEAKEVASEVWCVPLPMIPKQGAAFSLSWPSSRNSLTKTELSLNA